jgi:hypothetical protein
LHHMRNPDGSRSQNESRGEASKLCGFLIF